MKICILTRYPPFTNELGGGHEAYVRNISSFLVQCGDEVTVGFQRSSVDHGSQGDSCKNIRLIQVPYANFPLLNMISLVVFFSKTLWETRGSFDLYVSHQILPALAACIVGAKPHIYTHHGFMFEHLNSGAAKQVYRFLEFTLIRIFGRRIACVFAMDEQSAERIRIHGICTETTPVFVDTERFNPDRSGVEVRRKFGLENGLVILSPKMFYAINGLEYIVEAFSVLSRDFPSSRLLLVGDGPLKSRIRSLVERLHEEDRVIFAGVQPPTTMPEVYAAADLVVFHALGGIQRTALLEAMASGKACIGTDISPFNEVLKHGENGYLVEPRSSSSLARLMRDLLTEQNLRDKIGIEARRTVENVYSSQLALKTRLLYERVLLLSKNSQNWRDEVAE